MAIDWKECVEKRIAKQVREDADLIISLVRSSDNKFVSEEKLEMSTVTASSKVSLAYDSLRELLESLALQRGFKIYNHECYTAFLKEIIKESARGDEFDEIRKVRNAINYYGKELSVEEAGEIIRKIKDLREFVSGLAKK